MSMQELLVKVEEVLQAANLPERHSFYQVAKFIIGKEVTPQAQLWQIVRELQARKETVESYRKDLLDAEDNLELVDIKIERLSREIREESKQEGVFTDLNIQEKEINIKKLQRDKQSLILSARKVNYRLKGTLEEMNFLLGAYEQIVAQVGPTKPFDDEEAQKEMWNEKLLEELNLRFLLQRPLEPELAKTIMCLHDNAPVKNSLTRLLEFKQQHLKQQQLMAKKEQGI